jgi:hypothetical protein
VPRVTNLLQHWTYEGCESLELTRRLIDLFFVSVLLDAGAGDYWRYTEPNTTDVYERSEGIAVASLHMFQALAFTSSRDTSAPTVDGNPQHPVLSNSPNWLAFRKRLRGSADEYTC